ncbi:UNVERIFIED_CONTAM: hypothetical protein FKN15_056911 [Acipenser sinensis]
MAEREERTGLLEGEDDSESSPSSSKYCSSEKQLSACCDPSRLLHRIVVLIFMCFLGFGSYFCYDNPAALQTQIVQDMDLNTSMFMQLYAWYSWPNVVLCFLGGFLLDRVFGIRRSFTNSSMYSGHTQLFPRFFLSSMGSTVNMNIMGWIYSSVKGLVGSPGHTTLGITLLIGEVIKLTDVKDFSISLWLIFIICVCYYVAVFPFIGLGQVFFIEKFNFSPEQARAINSMQSIQNLGLALISIAAGYILDNHGYLFLEVFFSACVCLALIAVVMLYFVDLLRGNILK